MEENKKKIGRPRLSEEEKRERARKRATGELPSFKRPDIVTDIIYKDVPPGDNAKYLSHAMAIMAMPKIDITDPEQVKERIWWYFQHCANNDMKPTVKGFSNAIGVHRDTIHAWKTGEFRSGTHQKIILEAYDLLEEMWENYMQNGKINPVAGIFLAKNNFGYRDSKEFVVAPERNRIEVEDYATLEAKYAELPELPE